MKLLLTYLNEEPVNIEDFQEVMPGCDSFTLGLTPTEDLEKTAEEFSGLLDTLKFPFYYKEETLNKGTWDEVTWNRFYYANNKYLLKRFYKAYRKMNHARIGQCYKIPETAIEAFLGKKPRKDFQELKDAVPPILEFFLRFAPSDEFFEQELEIGKKRMEKVKAMSPDLYEEAFAIHHRTHPLHQEIRDRDRNLLYRGVPTFMRHRQMEDKLHQMYRNYSKNNRYL
jgi:hypothetical protein